MNISACINTGYIIIHPYNIFKCSRERHAPRIIESTYNKYILLKKLFTNLF